MALHRDKTQGQSPHLDGCDGLDESSLLPSTEICPFFFPFLSPLAAYPAAYGQISQAFPQPPPMIPQQQREGE